MRRTVARLLALTFGLACSSVIGFVAWACLRTPQAPRPEPIPHGPPTRLAGSVVDGATGVGGAVVWLHPRSDDGMVHLDGAEVGDGWWVRCDSAGRFDVTVLDPRACEAMAKLPGGGSTEAVPIDFKASDPVTIEIPVTGPRLTGRVLDAVSRAPVEGAALCFVSTRYYGPKAPAVSAGDGSFTLARPPAKHQVIVEHASHVTRLFDPPAPDTEPWTIELEPEAVIEGELLDVAGNHVAEPMAVLVYRDDHADLPSGDCVLYTEFSGGKFRVGGVAAGRLRVGLTAPLHGDLCWTLDCLVPGLLLDQVVDTSAGAVAHVTLQESIPISLPAPSKH